MKTIQVKYHHEESGLCQTTFKAVGEKRYFNRVESANFGCWCTVYPSQGLWESSDKVKDDVVFEILDNNGNILFAESNANLGAFKSIGKKASEVASEYADSLSLRPHEEWNKWLRSDMGTFGYTGDPDNWLYADPIVKHAKILSEYKHLGLVFRVIIEDVVHPICGKTWNIVYIQNIQNDNYESICGYHLDIGTIPLVKVRNLSQLKQVLIKGADFYVAEHRHPELVGERRRVNYANTTGIYTVIPDKPDSKATKANGGKGSFLGWGKASDWEFRDDGVCALYSSGSKKISKNIVVAVRPTGGGCYNDK